MKYQLNRILDRMLNGHTAIVRYRQQNMVETHVVEMTENKALTIMCCLGEGKRLPRESVQVVLILKQGRHYLYCNGKVSAFFLHGRLFRLELLKASFFVRRKTKNSSWLQQVFQYEQQSSLTA